MKNTLRVTFVLLVLVATGSSTQHTFDGGGGLPCAPPIACPGR